MIPRFAAGAVALFVLLFACGGENAASPPAAAASAATPPGPDEWDKWSHEKKIDYMKAAVMLKLGGAFHDLDGAKFAAPKCTLCHSAGALDGSFKMPDANLPKLPADPADFKAVAAKNPQMFDFMVKTVTPQMAALVGEQPYDPTTKTGFGCFECHTKQ
jgi:hypothetical protein